MHVARGHESLSNIFTDKTRTTIPLHRDKISNVLKNEDFIWARYFYYVLLHFMQKDLCNKSTHWALSYWNTLWTHHPNTRLSVPLSLRSASPWSHLQSAVLLLQLTSSWTSHASIFTCPLCFSCSRRPLEAYLYLWLSPQSWETGCSSLYSALYLYVLW